MISLMLISLTLLAQPETAVGPRSGALVIDGGGQDPASVRAFVALAGGPDAEYVLIPTATEAEPDAADLERGRKAFERAFGVSHVTVLHTRDRAVADSEAFAAPLKTATGVWFGGGRQWRLVNSYMGTRTQREIEGVLARGGVVGGSSAGATIQGSYLVRGAARGQRDHNGQGLRGGVRLPPRRGHRPASTGPGPPGRPGRCHRQEAGPARHRPRRADRDRRQGRSLPRRGPERGGHL